MFKSVNKGILPTRGSKYSACVDLYANKTITIAPGETTLVPLGVCIDFDKLKENFNIYHDYFTKIGIDTYDMFLKTHYLQLMLRSSMSKHLIIANGVGVIDLDYSDEIMIRLHNPVNMDSKQINKGDRVAQATMLKHLGFMFDIHSNQQRTGGFGSTGA